MRLKVRFRWTKEPEYKDAKTIGGDETSPRTQPVEEAHVWVLTLLEVHSSQFTISALRA